VSTLAELVVERPSRARLFERLGLDYCCGGGIALADACRERGLDPETVETLLAALDDDRAAPAVDWAHAPLADLCEHIVDAHHGLLRRELPRLSGLLAKCEHAHGLEHPELVELRGVFERLREELESHLDEEERELFPLVSEGGRLDPELVGALRTEHGEVGRLLAGLSALTFGYDEALALCNTHRASLAGLAELERDLHEHVHEENNILFPRALAS
jgi:regulator of cell morphogenesis and NO signaling